MGLFSFIKKPQYSAATNSEEVFQAVAGSIVQIAFDEAQGYKQFGVDIAADAATEYIFILLHYVDVNAFAVLGEKGRNEAYDRIVLLTIIKFTDRLFSNNAPEENIALYRQAMLSECNSRNLSYGLCKGNFVEIELGFSFFVTKALGFTDRENIDDIISDRNKYSDEDWQHLPNPEIMENLSKQIYNALTKLDLVRTFETIK